MNTKRQKSLLGILEDDNHKELYIENYKTLLRKFKEDLNTALGHVYALELSLLQECQSSPNLSIESTQFQ